MSRLVDLLLKIYKILLCLYPPAFRDEFKEEMTGVFAQEMAEAVEQGGWRLTAVYLGEIREIPFNLVREYWHALTKKELKMTIIAKPNWSFYPIWVAVTVVCIPISYLINLVILHAIVQNVGGYMYVNGVRHITEDYLLLYTIVPIAGLSTGLLQYWLLRRYLAKMGWWVLATAGGWLLGGLLILGASGFTIWIMGPLASGVAFLIMGLSIGFGQWLLLRRRLPRAGWWLAGNVAGWGLLALISGKALNQYGVVMLGFLPACVTAVALANFFKTALQAEPQNTGA